MGNEIFWFAPDERAIIPLAGFHVSRSLRRVVRQGRYRVVADQAFEAVIRACAAPRPRHPDTWISEAIVQSYTALAAHGWAHSVECYEDDELVGGLYGVAIGGAFFGESMFHRRRDASKVALVHLVERLRQRGYVLLDVQYMTPHLARFGACEITREEYEQRLSEAISVDVEWGGRAMQ